MNKIIATLFLVFATGAFAQVDITALLSDPKYQPFIQAVLTNATVCITDPAILSGDFDLDQCPGLESLLDQIDNNVANPTVTCEPSCTAAFQKLSDPCYTALKGAFISSSDTFGKLAGQFFAACDQASVPSTPSPTPTPSATPTPMPTPSNITPIPTPTSPSSSSPTSWAAALAPQVLVLVLINIALFLVV